ALEYALGRKVPLDVIDVGMRADDVAAALSAVHGMPPAHDQRPLVFLMPGLADDEQRLALFRTALRDRVRFHLVEYPDWPEMARPNWGFSDLAASIERQVLAHSAGAPILLSGYSFGGEVAFAVARRLIASGRDVRWVGI